MRLSRVNTFGPLFVLIIFIYAIVDNYYNPINEKSVLLSETINLDSSAILSFTTENKYSATYGVPGQGMYEWDIIVEPYKTTTFTATIDGIDSTSMGEFIWEINGDVLIGQQIDYTFTKTGKYPITLSFDMGDYSLDLQKDVMCKYVRRELRSLDDEDRERFLSALYTLYYVPTEEGQETYGSDYLDIASFVSLHLEGAASRDCDHWHDGAGIVTRHVGFTFLMEKVLQSIDPSITVPYWEYSYDAENLGTNWEQSTIFEDDWFGVASPDNTLQTITEGRWAYTPILTNANSNYAIFSPRGYLRSPWNVNSVPYITRHNKVMGQSYYQTFPGCSILQECFSRNSIALMNECLNGATHGPVHVMVGGEWSDSIDKVITSYNLSPVLLFLSKNLWRQGYMNCDDSCDTDSNCDCSCDASLWGDKTPYDLLNQTGILNSIHSISPNIYYDDNDDKYHISGSEQNEVETWKAILNALCTPGSVGEMFTSAAPYDPLFWVIHTTLERFLQYKRILSAKGELEFDETWGYSHLNAASDTGVVCDWSELSNSEGLPKCVKKDCSGHDEDDDLPFYNLVNGKTFTNGEFYEYLDPSNEDLPYVYDNFNYDHCSDIGIDFLHSIPKPGKFQ